MPGIPWRNVFALALAAFFAVGALSNIFAPGTIYEEYLRWGYPRWFHFVTGSLELTTAVLLARPSTRLLGSALGCAVMLGALATVTFHGEYGHAAAPLVVAALTVVVGWGARRDMPEAAPPFGAAAVSPDQLDAVIRLVETERVALTARQRKPALTMFADHDAYIAEAPEDLRPLLVRLRAQLALALPDAEEVIAYRMPGFRIGQTIVAGYAAFSKQCGLYIAPSAITSHADDIAAAGLKSTKTGVTFSPSQPIPDGLIEKLALASRRGQNL